MNIYNLIVLLLISGAACASQYETKRQKIETAFENNQNNAQVLSQEQPHQIITLTEKLEPIFNQNDFVAFHDLEELLDEYNAYEVFNTIMNHPIYKEKFDDASFSESYGLDLKKILSMSQMINLISKFSHIQLFDGLASCAIRQAIKSDDLGSLKQILDHVSMKIDINEELSDGNKGYGNILEVCASKNAVNCAGFILDTYPEIDLDDVYRRCVRKSSRVAKLINEKRPDYDINNDGPLAFSLCQMRNDNPEKTIEFINLPKIDVNKADEDGYTPLMGALELDPRIAAALLARGAKLNSVTRWGENVFNMIKDKKNNCNPEVVRLIGLAQLNPLELEQPQNIDKLLLFHTVMNWPAQIANMNIELIKPHLEKTLISAVNLERISVADKLIDIMKSSVPATYFQNVIAHILKDCDMSSAMRQLLTVQMAISLQFN